MRAYMVSKPRKSDYPHPIAVRKGEAVAILRESVQEDGWTGWTFCGTASGEGWIPRELIAVHDGTGILLDDYCAEEFDLETGDMLMPEKEINGWIWCAKAGRPDKMAWAPLDHLIRLDDAAGNPST